MSGANTLGERGEGFRYLLESIWTNEGGKRYTPLLATWDPEGLVAFVATAEESGLSLLRTEAEWAARGIRTAEAWERHRAAEAKVKADRAEAARVQAEAQADAFKAALSDLTEMVTALRQELAQVREDIAALRRGA